MHAFKIALLAAVAILLLVQIIDRSREPAQLKAVKDSMDAQVAANRALVDELKRLREAVESRPVVTAAATQPGTSTQSPTPANDPSRDGDPKLGVNFLLPEFREHWHPEWVAGTRKLFNETPKGFNPLLDNSTTSRGVHELVNDSLCGPSPKDPERYTEGLATSVVISDDWKVYTFTLRKGVRWQRPILAREAGYQWLDREVAFTSADLAFTMATIMNPDVDCPDQRNYCQDVDRWETPDPQTFRLIWKKRVYTSISFSLSLTPLPKHIYGANPDGTPIPDARFAATFNKHWFDEKKGIVGVGPFQVEQFEPDVVLRLRRNPDFWGVPPNHFERIEMNLQVRQPDAQLVAFKNGQVPAHGLAPLQFKSEVLDRKEPRFAAADPADPKAGRRGEYGWEKVARTAYNYLGWNLRRPMFQDKRVRQALAYAFPKERIIRDVFLGLGRPIMGDILPGSRYLNTELVPYGFDLAKARSLLAEAGWSDRDGDGVLDKELDGKLTPFRFTFKYYANSPEWDNTLAIYRNELKAIGIDLDPKNYEWKELIRVYEDRDFDAVGGGWQMDFLIDYYQLWHSSQDAPGGSNHIGYKNTEVDRLAEQLRETFEVDARIAIVKRIQEILHDEQPYLFFRSAEGVFVWQNHPPAGQTIEPDRWLDGVTTGLDQLHPMRNTQSLFWHFRN